MFPQRFCLGHGDAVRLMPHEDRITNGAHCSSYSGSYFKRCLNAGDGRLIFLLPSTVSRHSLSMNDRMSQGAAG